MYILFIYLNVYIYIYIYILYKQTLYITSLLYVTNYIYIFIFEGGGGGYHSHTHGTYENSMHVSYNLNISSITRNNIVDNIMS